MKTFRSCFGILAVFVGCVIFSGCANHAYQANTAIPRAQYPAAIERAKRSKWYMVLHSGINVYSITSVQVDKSKQQATVQLDKVDSSYLAATGNSRRISAMHWYTVDSTSYTLDEPHTIVLDKITKMERVDQP